MSNFFKKFSPLLLLLLELCISVSGNFTIQDLGLVCAVRMNTVLTSIPAECTAVSVYSTDMDQLGAVNQMRGELPLVIIVGHVEWKNLDDVINKNIGDLMNPFENVGYDVMLFDNTYKNVQIFGGASEVSKYSIQVGDFLHQVRASHPGKLFGLVLGHDVIAMQDRIDLSLVGIHSDLFLLESTGYRDCGIHTHQADMEVLATKDDVLASITDLRAAKVPIDKTLYTIELKIESRNKGTYEDMDYSYLCSNELSDDRKYCFNTIQNLVEKARLRISEGALGIFINGVEFDDYDGSCGCVTSTDPSATFRGLKTISGASLEENNTVSFYDCSAGQYPVIISSD